jgi:hypothetical protein
VTYFQCGLFPMWPFSANVAFSNVAFFQCDFFVAPVRAHLCVRTRACAPVCALLRANGPVNKIELPWICFVVLLWFCYTPRMAVPLLVSWFRFTALRLLGIPTPDSAFRLRFDSGLAWSGWPVKHTFDSAVYWSWSWKKVALDSDLNSE